MPLVNTILNAVSSKNQSKLQPTATDIARSHLLSHSILKNIKENDGSISFAAYMQQALYTHKLGYYACDSPKFGASGDFITAPELSPLFSITLSKTLGEVLAELKQGMILELGAGSGKMAADILKALKQQGQLPEYYLIFEVSDSLKTRQQKTLQKECPELLSRVRWLHSLPLSEPITGIILANEVCDAMPVHRFLMQDHSLFEVCVKANESSFLPQPSFSPYLKTIDNHSDKHNDSCFLQRSNLDPFLETYAEFEQRDRELPYCSEINLQITPWMRSLNESLKAGLILVLDYGFPRHEFYHPDRKQGTLLCHYQHHVMDDPFYYPGLLDITAHVDFTSLAEAGIASGLEVAGFTSQASFLLAAGLIEAYEEQKKRCDEKEIIRLNQAFQTLTSPAEMGELIKVMGFSKNLDKAIKEFSINDKRYRL